MKDWTVLKDFGGNNIAVVHPKYAEIFSRFPIMLRICQMIYSDFTAQCNDCQKSRTEICEDCEQCGSVGTLKILRDVMVDGGGEALLAEIDAAMESGANNSDAPTDATTGAMIELVPSEGEQE